MDNTEKLDRTKAIYNLAKKELNRINRAFSSGGSSMVNVSGAYIDMLDYVMEHAFNDIIKLSNIKEGD
jgi:hypothetical protein